MENGELGRFHWVVCLVLLCCHFACATTDKQGASGTNRQRSVEAAVADVLKVPRYVLLGGEGADEAALTFKDKVEQLDVAGLNAAIVELRELLKAVQDKVQQADTGAMERIADDWGESAEKLSATLETLEQKFSAIESEQFNRAIQNISELAQSWQASGRELQALLADVRQLLDEIDSKEITGTIEQLHQSSQHIEKAAAKLPSTSTSLSTTLWLLNALLAIGITLGVIRIVRSRSSNRRS